VGVGGSFVYLLIALINAVHWLRFVSITNNFKGRVHPNLRGIFSAFKILSLLKGHFAIYKEKQHTSPTTAMVICLNNVICRFQAFY